MATYRQLAHVTLSGDIVGEYVVEDRQPDGRLVLVPDAGDDYPRVKWADMKDPAARDMAPEEFAAFIAEHGPHMLPPRRRGVVRAPIRAALPGALRTGGVAAGVPH